MKTITKIMLSAVVASTLSADMTVGGVNGAVLGGMGLKNYQTSNALNMWANPATTLKFKNLTILGLGTNGGDSYFAGTTYDLSDSAGVGVVGIWTGRANLNSGLISAAGLGSSDNLLTNDILYGIDLGKMIVGTRVSLSSYTNTVTTGEVTTGKSASDTSIDLGVIMKDQPFSGTLTLDKTSFSQITSETNKKESDNFANIAANVQYTKIAEGNMLVATGYFSTNDLAAKITSGSTATTSKDSTITLGVNAALNIVSAKNSKIVIALGLQSVSHSTMADAEDDKNSTTASTTNMPFNIAFEQRATNNIIWRVGASRDLSNSTTTVTTTNGVESTAVKSASKASKLTTGFTYGITPSLKLVGVVSKDFYIAGPNLISGSTNDMLATGAFAYKF